MGSGMLSVRRVLRDLVLRRIVHWLSIHGPAMLVLMRRLHRCWRSRLRRMIKLRRGKLAVHGGGGHELWIVWGRICPSVGVRAIRALMRSGKVLHALGVLTAR